MLDSIKKFFQKIKLQKIAVVSVILVQAFKRVVNSEITLFIVELLPLPWATTILKLFGYFKKADEIFPVVIKNIIFLKGLTTEENIDNKTALSLFSEYVNNLDKDKQNEIYQFFALEISKALIDDNKVDDEEIKQINDAAYQKFFKNK